MDFSLKSHVFALLVPQRGRSRYVAAGFIITLTLCQTAWAQTTTYWDGSETGAGSSWGVSANWAGDIIPPNASNSHVIIDNRNGAGTITFDDLNSKLSAILNGAPIFPERPTVLGAGLGLRVRGEITGVQGINKTGNGRVRIEGGG